MNSFFKILYRTPPCKYCTMQMGSDYLIWGWGFILGAFIPEVIPGSLIPQDIDPRCIGPTGNWYHGAWIPRGIDF